MRENVLSLTVVLADGRVIRTVLGPRKSAAAYDLTRLFVGSEGTLGVITEVTLKLYGIPEAISAAVCAFPTIEDAVDTVILTIQSGVPVARIELLDEAQIDAINKYSKLDHPVAPTLFFELHGTTAGVAEQFAIVKEIAADRAAMISAGPRRRKSATNCGRRGTMPIMRRWRCGRGSQGWPTDVCVPILAPGRMYRRDQTGSCVIPIPSAMVGHVGDGNFHLGVATDPKKPEEIAEAVALMTDW